ncbi:MAG: SHOCT domain-containing protein [Rickettsiales bacterium]
MRYFTPFSGLLCLLALMGCGGGGADANVQATTVSKGQELIDLKKAHDSGVIDEDEYEDQKRAILRR